jgi:hypothetical protein
MSNGYRLYVPFDLAEGRDIGNPIPFKGEVGGYVAEIKRVEPHFAVLLEQIPSEQEAASQFEKLIVALYWVALEARCGVLLKSDLQEVYFPMDPIQAAKNIFGEGTDRRADVVIHGGDPAIWPDDKSHVTFTGLRPKVIVSYSPSRFLDMLNEGMKLRNAAAVLTASKLRLAIDLYCLSHFRSSDFARFLVLCTVLETAAPEPALSEPCVSLIDEWIKQARAESEMAIRNQAEKEEFTSLAKRLNYLKTQSHRSRVAQYVKDMLGADGHSDAETLAGETKTLWDVRGELSHTGVYELGDRLSRLDDIVRKTLKAAMRHVSA